ncbi:hypothetical protein NA57DRAFT_57050 [Rhizodiscina lignyota]|uniref:Uncharacterized protein n=1 Tax=Rhizodiscina lignyota TaxID=1504668 RepID=A0A9P4M810_9PEZI|nr:hypothetical protein NA57DRAFT_57050 [Rhizodiscina lignyota]
MDSGIQDSTGGAGTQHDPVYVVIAAMVSAISSSAYNIQTEPFRPCSIEEIFDAFNTHLFETRVLYNIQPDMIPLDIRDILNNLIGIKISLENLARTYQSYGANTFVSSLLAYLPEINELLGYVGLNALSMIGATGSGSSLVDETLVLAASLPHVDAALFAAGYWTRDQRSLSPLPESYTYTHQSIFGSTAAADAERAQHATLNTQYYQLSEGLSPCILSLRSDISTISSIISVVTLTTPA